MMTGASLTLRPQTQTLAEPSLLAWDSLWQHELPLLDFLREHYGDRPLDSFGGSYGWSVRYRQVEDYEALRLTSLADYIDRFRAGDQRLPYLRHLSVNRSMPELRRFIRHPAVFEPNWVSHPRLDRYGGPELFLGQAGTGFGNFHQDHSSVHIGFVQLEGTKEFTLFPPDDGQHLYRLRGGQFPYQWRNSRIRLDDLNNYDRYPALRNVTPRVMRVHAGQALLLPADWWHNTRNLTDSVSYSVRIINRTNIGAAIMRHIEGLVAAPLRLIGR